MLRAALTQMSRSSLFMRSTPLSFHVKEKKSSSALAIINSRFNSGVDRHPLISILHDTTIEIGGKQ